MERLSVLDPAGVYAVVGVLAGVENIFPPIPADTAIALGAFLSGAGRVSAGVVFLITWLANAAGAGAVYLAARRAGRPFFTGPLGRRLLKPAALARVEALYARYGMWAIFLSRFVPGVRAVVPPFAGIAGLGAARAMVPTVVASGIWYGTLTWVAARVVRHADDVATLIGRVNRVALIAVAAVIVALAVRVVARRRGTGTPPGD